MKPPARFSAFGHPQASWLSHSSTSKCWYTAFVFQPYPKYSRLEKPASTRESVTWCAKKKNLVCSMIFWPLWYTPSSDKSRWCPKMVLSTAWSGLSHINSLVQVGHQTCEPHQSSSTAMRYPRQPTWMFPEIRVPHPNIHFNRIFPFRPSILGDPCLRKTHMAYPLAPVAKLKRPGASSPRTKCKSFCEGILIFADTCWPQANVAEKGNGHAKSEKGRWKAMESYGMWLLAGLFCF